MGLVRLKILNYAPCNVTIIDSVQHQSTLKQPTSNNLYMFKLCLTQRDPTIYIHTNAVQYLLTLSEATLTCCISFPEPCSKLRNYDAVEENLKQAICCLKDYIKCSYPEKTNRFAQIILKLPSLREVCINAKKQSLFAKSFASFALPTISSMLVQQ